MYGVSVDSAVRVLRERIGVQGYPSEEDVWRLLEVLEEGGEVRTAMHDAPSLCVMAGHDGVPVIYLTSRIPRSRQARAVFEEIAHLLLCGPGLACLPPGQGSRLRFFLAANDRDESDADALWLAWRLPWELMMHDAEESAILEASGCEAVELEARMGMFLR